mmetsp:Transcript_8364/g.25277  ORF Transcript_8364/g.25277 Transcript_8364/m.25277 type:complete len:164 (-) Transcript_8364:91-582(-)
MHVAHLNSFCDQTVATDPPTAPVQMDASILHLFDPNGYLQRNLSLIQASPAAVHVLARHPHKSHEPEHVHFCDTSPLLRAALSEPASADARRILNGRAGRGVKAKAAPGATAPYQTRLTKQQQSELYAEVQAIQAAPDTCRGLVHISGPVQATTRDTWIPKPR